MTLAKINERNKRMNNQGKKNLGIKIFALAMAAILIVGTVAGVIIYLI